MGTSYLLKINYLIFFILLSIQSPQAKQFSGFGAEIDSYIQESAQRYNISEKMLRGLVKIEDGWYGKVSPTGATGVGQFTVTTWNWLANTIEGKNIGMQPITIKNKGTYKDPRRDKRINTLATGLYAKWHIAQFAERGIKPTDENLYMAHNIGLDGLHRALIGKSTSEDIKNMRKNGMKRWMSVHDFIVYQKNRYAYNKKIANTNLNITYLTWKESNKNITWIQPSDNLVWINPQ